MSKLLMIFAEDTFAVLGFVLFAAVVYNLIAAVLRRRYGRGRTRTILDKRLAAGDKFLQKIFQKKDSGETSARGDFSRTDSAGSTTFPPGDV